MQLFIKGLKIKMAVKLSQLNFWVNKVIYKDIHWKVNILHANVYLILILERPLTYTNYEKHHGLVALLKKLGFPKLATFAGVLVDKFFLLTMATKMYSTHIFCSTMLPR